MEDKYAQLKTLCRTLYDYQAIRIALYNRIVSREYLEELVDSTESKKGKEMTDEQKSKRRAKLIESMISWYKEYHEKVEAPRTIRGKVKNLETLTAETNGPITDYLKYTIVKDYVNISEREADIKAVMTLALRDFPIYNEFLKDAPGCGPMMSAIIITNLDVHKAKHVSSFWRYCGLDTWENPETGERVARSNKKEQLIERDYIDRNGKPAKKLSVTYNPAFRTKMLGVLGDSFIKHGKQYRVIYDNAKTKYSTGRDGWSKQRIHRAAIRIAVREFLRDLWTKWRELEGYPPEDDWNTMTRGRAHGESLQPEPEVKTDAAGNLIPEGIDDDMSPEQLNLLLGEE